MTTATKVKTEKPRNFLTLDDIDARGKTVLVRVDLNVPMSGGRVTDKTRIVRLLPTLHDLLKQKAKVVLLSHLGRPDGKFEPSLSLAPLVDELSEMLGEKVPVAFSSSNTGHEAEAAVERMPQGSVLLLENLRFHEEEEANDTKFAKGLAALGDIYVNDAFSCAHRAHASTEGIAHYLPKAAGRLMQEELEILEEVFAGSKRPLVAVVGGSKISTKLALLENLSCKVDHLIVGGAMANTFLLAQGHEVGASLVEKNLVTTAKRILAGAKKNGCDIVLPDDVVVAETLSKQAACKVVNVDHIGKRGMILDIGPKTVMRIIALLQESKTVVWNGPLGAFETSPFDGSTVMVARAVAGMTGQKKMQSVAGGGDTVAALTHAGLASGFSYLSTAGGAFLEWMEGKALPGVKALRGK